MMALAVLALTAVASVAQSQGQFRGYPCTVDCSGHDAGYEWAEKNEITEPADCGGNSSSFIEGCEAYAEEQQDRPRPQASARSLDAGKPT